MKMSLSLREKVLKEILHTEGNYLKQLEVLDKYFAKPCIAKELISLQTHTFIFGELDALRHINEELYRQLNSSDSNVGQAFLHMAPFLQVYASYANNFQHALEVLQEVENKNVLFKSWLSITESRPEVQNKIASLLITPVQRVPRYRLLLEELLRHTSSDHPHHTSITNALVKVSLTAELINAKIQEGDGLQRLLMVQRALKNGRPNIVAPGRKLIKEGVVNKVSRKGKGSQPRLFFLLTDMLVYTKPPMANMNPGDTSSMDFKVNSLECCCVLPLKHCVVSTIFANQGGLTFKVQCESEEIVLFSSDQSAGQEWERILRETINKLLENRRTLRKESSARKPMRRPALRKLKAWGNEEEIQLLRATKHIQAEFAKPASPKAVTPVKKTSQTTPVKVVTPVKTTPVKTPVKTTPVKTTAKQTSVLDCITPPKKWFSPFSQSRKNKEKEVKKENIDKKRNLGNTNRDNNNVVQRYRPRSEVINATVRCRENNPYRPHSDSINGSVRSVSNDNNIFIRPKSIVDCVQDEPRRDLRPSATKRAASGVDYCTIVKRVKEDTVGSTGLHSSYKIKNEVERRTLAHRGLYIGGTLGGTQPGTRYSGRRLGPSPLTISSKTQ